MVDAKSSLKRIVGQIFRLLPTFEEGQDWIKPIDTLIIELTGMALSLNAETKIYQLIYKGYLPAIKLGSMKVLKSSLEKFLIVNEGNDLSDLDNIKKLEGVVIE